MDTLDYLISLLNELGSACFSLSRVLSHSTVTVNLGKYVYISLPNVLFAPKLFEEEWDEYAHLRLYSFLDSLELRNYLLDLGDKVATIARLPRREGELAWQFQVPLLRNLDFISFLYVRIADIRALELHPDLLKLEV